MLHSFLRMKMEPEKKKNVAMSFPPHVELFIATKPLMWSTLQQTEYRHMFTAVCMQLEWTTMELITQQE